MIQTFFKKKLNIYKHPTTFHKSQTIIILFLKLPGTAWGLSHWKSGGKKIFLSEHESDTKPEQSKKTGLQRTFHMAFPGFAIARHGLSHDQQAHSATCIPNPRPWATQGRCFIIMRNKKPVKVEWSLPVNYHWIWGSLISVATAFLVTTAAMEAKAKGFSTTITM